MTGPLWERYAGPLPTRYEETLTGPLREDDGDLVEGPGDRHRQHQVGAGRRMTDPDPGMPGHRAQRTAPGTRHHTAQPLLTQPDAERLADRLLGRPQPQEPLVAPVRRPGAQPGRLGGSNQRRASARAGSPRRRSTSTPTGPPTRAATTTTPSTWLTLTGRSRSSSARTTGAPAGLPAHPDPRPGPAEQRATRAPTSIRRASTRWSPAARPIHTYTVSRPGTGSWLTERG